MNVFFINAYLKKKLVLNYDVFNQKEFLSFQEIIDHKILSAKRIENGMAV